jgi:hypothetical protein
MSGAKCQVTSGCITVEPNTHVHPRLLPPYSLELVHRLHSTALFSIPVPSPTAIPEIILSSGLFADKVELLLRRTIQSSSA